VKLLDRKMSSSDEMPICVGCVGVSLTRDDTDHLCEFFLWNVMCHCGCLEDVVDWCSFELFCQALFLPDYCEMESGSAELNTKVRTLNQVK